MRPYKGHSCHKIIGPGDCRQDNDCRYGYYRKQYKNSVESCWPRGKKVKLQVGRGPNTKKGHQKGGIKDQKGDQIAHKDQKGNRIA